MVTVKPCVGLIGRLHEPPTMFAALAQLPVLVTAVGRICAGARGGRSLHPRAQCRRAPRARSARPSGSRNVGPEHREQAASATSDTAMMPCRNPIAIVRPIVIVSTTTSSARMGDSMPRSVALVHPATHRISAPRASRGRIHYRRSLRLLRDQPVKSSFQRRPKFR